VSSQLPVPAGNVEMRSELPLDFLDYVLFLPSIWLTCSLAISGRLMGPLFVVIPVGVCASSARPGLHLHPQESGARPLPILLSGLLPARKRQGSTS
jgi:hypothetical protein